MEFKRPYIIRYLPFLRVDFRYSKELENDRLLIKTSSCLEPGEKIILENAGFEQQNEDSQMWIVDNDVLEKYLLNCFKSEKEKINSILIENNITNFAIDYDSPFFRIKSSSKSNIVRIKRVLLRAGIMLHNNSEETLCKINVWDLITY